MPVTTKRIFISSTSIDLPEHRQKVIDACNQLGLMPDGMEHWPAADAKALTFCLDKINQTDVFIGIYAHRYGWIPPGESRSITELEYDRAVERGIPRYLFVMGKKHPILAKDVETGSGAEALKAFKQRISGERVWKTFDNADQLHAHVLHALFANINPQIGIGQAPTMQWEIGQLTQENAYQGMHSRSQPEQKAFDQVQATEASRPSVYVSYAWGGESDATVAALQDALAPWVKVHRDKEVMRPGDSIRQFEEEIGRGLCVIVVLSAKYTQSIDCMRELGFIWERAQRQPEQFAKRIIPVVLEDAGIGALAGRLKCVQHWQNELKQLDTLVRGIGPADCGQSTTQQLQDIKTFTVHLADALNTFADRMMPRATALSAAEFAPVVELVKKRCGL